jgi:hypothetical protein
LMSNPEMKKQAMKLGGSMGFTHYIPANWGNMAVILPFFAIAQMDASAYIASFDRPEHAQVEAARTKKESYKEEYEKKGIPVDHQDPRFQQFNKGGAQRKDGKPVGKMKPIEKDHAWVVTIVKSSILDANRIDEELALKKLSDQALPEEEKQLRRQEILERYGLEPIPEAWKPLYEKGLRYWEP